MPAVIATSVGALKLGATLAAFATRRWPSSSGGSGSNVRVCGELAAFQVDSANSGARHAVHGPRRVQRWSSSRHSLDARPPPNSDKSDIARAWGGGAVVLVVLPHGAPGSARRATRDLAGAPPPPCPPPE